MTKKRLFYDIETSFCEGTFWRPGYNQTIHPNQILKYAQIICISWSWEGEDAIHHLDWGLKKQCDKKLLIEFIKQLDKADEIVAHNGDRFDIKWIRTRALFHGIEMRPSYNSIDTLKLCKAYLNLPSNKLSEVARYFNLTAKLDPGGLQTWIDIILNKSQDALDTMLVYCDGDITTLKEVYYKLRQYTRPKFNYAVINGGERFECPECSSPLVKLSKTYTTSQGTIRHNMKCRVQTCNTMYVINNLEYMKFLNYRVINGLN
tara:strand:- start:9710 stop:10492 length:783 start_codon:yes stop_codon:yes gene_type:complete